MKYWAVIDHSHCDHYPAVSLFYIRSEAADYVCELAKHNPTVQAAYLDYVEMNIADGGDNLVSFHEYIENIIDAYDDLDKYCIWDYSVQEMPLYYSVAEALNDAH